MKKLFKFFKYLDLKLPFYPMIYPGHTYEALEIVNLSNFGIKFLKIKILLIVLIFLVKKNIMELFEIIAEQKIKIFKLNISKWIQKF